jgi:signal peptidase II
VGRAARLAGALYGVAALVYATDRLSKTWAEGSLAGRPPLEVIPGVLQLNFTTNSGGAFSIGGSAPWLFAGATLVVVALIVAASARLTRPAIAVGLGLVLGGALGNLTDRIVRGGGLRGRVVDFIDLHVWPVFNLADSAIVVGAVVLLFASLHRERSALDPVGPSEGHVPRDETGEPVEDDPPST